MAARIVRKIVTIAVCCGTVFVAGCVVAPVGPYYGYDGEVVQVAPPAPRVEYYGAPPVVGQIWIGGFWGWNGGRHVWNGGHWDAPRPGHRWVPHAWERQGPGWRQRPGYWERR
jgi:hypothetical protein